MRSSRLDHVQTDLQSPATRDWTGSSIYALGFLTLISAINYLDRSILGLALPEIKREMGASDADLGLVSGLAFVAIYSVLGVPIAWLADRWNRRNIIGIGLAFWSLMTLATGYVANIWQLAVARLLVGAGEACGTAPSNSMLADTFRKARLPLVLAIFGTAASIASIVFYPLLGIVGDAHGWRAMFVAAGAPGMALAAVFLLTAKEPERGAVEVAAPRPAPESFWTAVRFLGGSRAYLLFLVGATFMGANVYAAAIWTPTFLSRVHDMNLAEIAGTTGQIRGWFGVAGVLAGGILADRLGQLDERWRVRIPAIACVLLGPAEALFLFSDPTLLWMSGYALTSFLTLLHQPPIFAAALSIASPRMRAVATSLLILCASLLGQVAGPFVVGYLNDKLHPTLGDAAIRYSLLVMAATAIAAGLAFWASARFIRGDVRRAAER